MGALAPICVRQRAVDHATKRSNMMHSTCQPCKHHVAATIASRLCDSGIWRRRVQSYLAVSPAESRRVRTRKMLFQGGLRMRNSLFNSSR